MSGFGKTTIFNGLLGNCPNVFCWASDYLIWSSFWSEKKIIKHFSQSEAFMAPGSHVE
jgi:hypothetical protein